MNAEPTAIPAVADVETLLAEERLHLLARFDTQAIWQLGLAISQEIQTRGLPAAVDVSRGLDTVFFFAGEGATLDNTDWIRRKKATVWRFRHSSLLVRRKADDGGYEFNKRFRLPEAEYAAAGGGVPIATACAGLVGIVTVSGLPSLDDHQLAIRHLAGLIKAQS